MATITIREAGEADRPILLAMTTALQRVESTIQPTPPDPAQQRAYVDALLTDITAGRARVLIAEKNTRPVGLLSCYAEPNPSPGALMLHDMFVTKAARRQGVGRFLTQQAETMAVALGLPRLLISAIPGNLAAQRAFRAMGFL